jgi:hypothetical protein
MPISVDNLRLAKRATDALERIDAALAALAVGDMALSSAKLTIRPPIIIGPNGTTTQPVVEVELDGPFMTSFSNWLSTVKGQLESRLTTLDVDLTGFGNR